MSDEEEIDLSGTSSNENIYIPLPNIEVEKNVSDTSSNEITDISDLEKEKQVRRRRKKASII